MKTLSTAHGNLSLPAFLPDATRAVVRTLDAADVVACGIDALMVNALHLAAHPGTAVVAHFGGIHAFMGWDGPVASDSGGFQAFSLVTGSPKLGAVSEHGFTYRLDKAGPKKTLTPEKCIRKQFQLGADILFCLDHCTHPDANPDTQRESVDHTVKWARECKDAFVRELEQRTDQESRPLLFAVIQGGSDGALRRECAERLQEIGFDGYGYGGWPIGDNGQLVDMVAEVAQLVPPEFPKHALGVGKPDNIVRAYRLGYDLFDCTIPTRDARHERLYILTTNERDLLNKGVDCYRCLNIGDERYVRDSGPINETCDCLCCRTYSRGYLHHLFRVRDAAAQRLATIHNLRTYARLMQGLRTASGNA
jgi:queuine tRNA-ribosyltransferase